MGEWQRVVAGYVPPPVVAIRRSLPAFVALLRVTFSGMSTLRRRGASWRQLLPLLVALAIGSCSPILPSQGRRGPAAPSARAADPLAPPWVVRNPGMRRTQRVEVRALLTSQVDSLVRVDTLRSLLEVAWSSVPGTTPPRVAGLFTEFRNAVGGDSLAAPANLALPFSFTSETRELASQPSFLIPDAASCASLAPAVVHGVRETWLSLPDTLWPDRAWRDSTTYQTCRDGIVLTVEMVREFTPSVARARDGQLVVLVSRHSRARVAGEGLQFGEWIALLGEGEGVMSLELALSGGVIVSGEGTSELRLEMRGRRRSQRLVQESRILIREP